MKMLIYFAFGVLVLSSGCAHFASNTRAWEEAPVLLPLPYSFIGNIFQVGPCASIEPLRIEIGVELDGIRGGVVTAIEKGEKTCW